MWEGTSWRFWKCGSFIDLEVLNHSYRLSKSDQIQRFFLLGRRRCKKKTRPQYWILGSETNSRASSHGWDDLLFVSDLKTHYCGRVFFLQRLLFLLTDPQFHSLMTLSSNNSPSKPDTSNKFHIFGKLWTWAFTWSYPGYFFLWANFEEWAFYGKHPFLTFFHDHTKKKIKWPLIGQYWSLTPCP